MTRKLLAFLAVSLATAHARAEVSATATARELAIQGIERVEAGDCERGEPLLEGAEKLHHASVHLQYIARCRARSGRLVSATELWRQIIREGAPSGSSPAVRAAVTEATTELSRTLPRLGTVTIRTTASYDGVELSLDGTTLPSVVLGGKQVLDPGPHELVARAPGYAPWVKRWALGDGETIDVQITLVPGGDDGHASTPAPGKALPRDASAGPGSLATTGWVLGIAGAGSMATGVVTWIIRNNQRTKLERDCSPSGCPQPPYNPAVLESDKQSIRDLTTATNILMFGGGALLAGGATLILLGTSRGRAAESARASPTFAPSLARGGAGMFISGQW